MSELDRRKLLTVGIALAIPLGGMSLIGGCQRSEEDENTGGSPKGNETDESDVDSEQDRNESVMRIQYLEIVTPDVDALCTQYAKAHGLTFSDPIAEFGNARTTKLSDGGQLGIRAPLRETETPVVRPYMLVDDIEAAVAAASDAGAEVAMPPMEIPGGQGTFAIVIHGGIDCGFWQL